MAIFFKIQVEKNTYIYIYFTHSCKLLEGEVNFWWQIDMKISFNKRWILLLLDFGSIFYFFIGCLKITLGCFLSWEKLSVDHVAPFLHHLVFPSSPWCVFGEKWFTAPLFFTPAMWLLPLLFSIFESHQEPSLAKSSGCFLFLSLLVAFITTDSSGCPWLGSPLTPLPEIVSGKGLIACKTGREYERRAYWA